MVYTTVCTIKVLVNVRFYLRTLKEFSFNYFEMMCDLCCCEITLSFASSLEQCCDNFFFTQDTLRCARVTFVGRESEESTGKTVSILTIIS